MATFAFKDVLNLAVFALSTVCKVPQVFLVLSSGSVEGLSPTSLILETVSTSITFCYFAVHDYPAADYLEYPLLMVQNMLLFFLFAFYRQVAPQRVVSMLALYLGAVYSLANALLPSAFLHTLSLCVIPLTSLSKLAQIRSIYQSKRGDLVSRLPWGIFAATSLARIYTVFLETADKLLLLQYFMSLCLNSLVIAVAVRYTPDRQRTKSD